jgi:hypothetical protein
MRFGLVAAALIGGLMLVGRSAEAQARGTLQASATVVDTRQGFGALSAVQQAITNSRTQSKETVQTVALVTTERSVADQKVVVTVDFARN